MSRFLISRTISAFALVQLDDLTLLLSTQWFDSCAILPVIRALLFLSVTYFVLTAPLQPHQNDQ
jgi:hypothetical protein